MIMDCVVDEGRTRLRARGLITLAGALVLTGGLLAACGGSKAAGSQAPQSEAPGQGQGQRQAQLPGASGTLAEIDGTTLQVQNPQSGQVAVTYGSSTAFTQTTTATAAAIKVGDCVTVIGVRSDASASATASSATAPTSFPAASVEISAAVNGNCTAAGFGGGGRGFGGGARPSGSTFPTARPSGTASGDRSGRNGFGGGFGDFATGKVTAVSSGTMTVQTAARDQQTSQTDTISLTSSTTYSENQPTTAAALKVGLCVFASGKSDTTGAIAATRIALSPAGANGCSSGFGRRPSASSTAGG